MSATSSSSARREPRSAWVAYGGLLAVFLAVIGVGYLGFRTFATTPDFGAFNLYLLAILAGVASFFSPCAFPLLPGYLSFYYQAGEQDEQATGGGAGRALSLGFAGALGVITFALILGLVIGVLGTGAGQALSISAPQPSQFVRVFRGAVGALLILLGIAQLAGWNLKPRFVDAFAYRTRPEREGRRGPAANLYFYGLGYTAAGIGCTGPILAGLIVFALASGGLASALTAFAVFSLTMGILMLLVSVLVGASRQSLITRLKAATPRIKWAASILLILVGVFNVYTALNQELFLRLLFPA